MRTGLQGTDIITYFNVAHGEIVECLISLVGIIFEYNFIVMACYRNRYQHRHTEYCGVRENLQHCSPQNPQRQPSLFATSRRICVKKDVHVRSSKMSLSRVKVHPNLCSTLSDRSRLYIVLTGWKREWKRESSSTFRLESLVSISADHSPGTAICFCSTKNLYCYCWFK